MGTVPIGRRKHYNLTAMQTKWQILFRPSYQIQWKLQLQSVCSPMRLCHSSHKACTTWKCYINVFSSSSKTEISSPPLYYSANVRQFQYDLCHFLKLRCCIHAVCDVPRQFFAVTISGSGDDCEGGAAMTVNVSFDWPQLCNAFQNLSTVHMDGADKLAHRDISRHISLPCMFLCHFRHTRTLDYFAFSNGPCPKRPSMEKWTIVNGTILWRPLPHLEKTGRDSNLQEASMQFSWS